jgi:putative nucleotidyltransferase with HDIG domain
MTVEPRGTVLVVEDEDIVRDLVVHVLQRARYQVAAAANGSSGLAALRNQSVDLILTDLRMPVMDGLELLREAKRLHPSVDVIVLTAYGTIDSAVQALKLGAMDYLAKPFEINELLEQVAQCFEQRERRATAEQSRTKPLLELNRILSRSGDLDSTLGQILTLIKTTFSPDRVHAELLDGWEDSDWLAAQLSDAAQVGIQLTADQIRALAESPTPWWLGEPGRPLGSHATPDGHTIAVPIASGAEVIGALLIARDAQSTPYTEADAQILHIFGAQIALAVLHGAAQRRLHQSFSQLQEMSVSAAEALAEALGTFDSYTRWHSRRVARYAKHLAQTVGLDARTCDAIEIAGLLHDIGKLGVGETTLRKNGALTEAERDRIRLHPIQGARILSGLDVLAEIIPIVRHHHERYDGRGYPDGLKGEDIPFGARLLAVVDAFDSMTNDRPYRRALSAEEAREEIRKGAGTQFDPSLVEAWLQTLDADEPLPRPELFQESYAREIAGR